MKTTASHTKGMAGAFLLSAVVGAGPAHAVEGGTGGAPSDTGATVFVATVSAQNGALQRSYCSGVLVAPTRVVTAAHCVQGSAASVVLVQHGQRVSQHAVRRILRSGGPVGPSVRPLGASISDLATDVAVLQLATPVTGEQAARRQPPAQALPLRLRLSGRGLSGANRYGGVRSTQLIAVAVTRGGLILARATDGAVCKGDSGAPVFAEAPGPPRLVGIASAVLSQDGRCGSTVLIARTAGR